MLHEGEVVSIAVLLGYDNVSLARCGKTSFAGRHARGCLSVEPDASGPRVQAIGWPVFDPEQSTEPSSGGAGGLSERALSPTGRTELRLP